ncbi:MAG: Gfo/Idh/MocA family oxidoreductase [Candidatus Hydrogenedentes bacterium]|nr:Gfo/Idh/MocA family oxidoreductase [Candidatus Hydrogenedentota bacterium]
MSALSRRQFLSTAAAGIALAPAFAQAAAPVGLGLIGCGWRGRQLLARIALMRDAGAPVRLAAVCDVFEPHKAVAREFCGTVTGDWRHVLARDDVRAVVIATPDHWHARMAIAAMEAGKDVYLEPPMALTIADAIAVRNGAQRTGAVVQIGVESMSHGAWRAARDEIARGGIGDVVWCQAAGPSTTQQPAVPGHLASGDTLDWEAFTGPAPARAFDAARFTAWRQYWDYSGGMATDAFYTRLAQLMSALDAGLPLRVSAAGGVYTRDGREAPDSLVMTAEFAGGESIVLASSPVRARSCTAVIRGSRGTIEFHDDHLRVESEPAPGSHFRTLSSSVEHRRVAVAAARDHLADWLACVQDRNRPAFDAAAAFAPTVAAAMAIDAYKQSKTLAWDPAQETAVPCLPRVALAPRGAVV